MEISLKNENKESDEFDVEFDVEYLKKHMNFIMIYHFYLKERNLKK